DPDRPARPAPRRDRPAAARVRGLGGLRGRAASRLPGDLAPADPDHPVLGQDDRRREARVDARDRVLLLVRVDLLLPARAAQAPRRAALRPIPVVLRLRRSAMSGGRARAPHGKLLAAMAVLALVAAGLIGLVL